jgi:signal transduction histidine kinase
VAATLLAVLAAASRGIGETVWPIIVTPDLALVGLLGGGLRRLFPSFGRQQSASRAEIWPEFGRISEPKGSVNLNSLASIQSAAGLLAEDDTPAAMRQELAGIISTECGRLSAGIKGLLQQDSGITPSQVGEADVASIVNAVVRQAEFVHCDHGVQVLKEIASDLPPIQCDPAQIHSLLLSLTTNVVQSAPAGARIILHAHRAEGGIILGVSEHSTGASLGRAIKRYFSAQPSTKTAGLAAAYEIVRQHGGTINAKIKVEKGLEFSVWLPLRQNTTNGCGQSTVGGR